MKLSVKILGGSECQVEVLDQNLIEEVKDQIKDKLKIEKDQQTTLLFKGKTLQDKSSISEYKLTDGSKLHLVVKGGSSGSGGNTKKTSSGVSESVAAVASSSVETDEIFRLFRKYFKSDEEARKLSTAFKKSLHRKLDNLSLDDIEKICENLNSNQKIIF